MDKKIILCVDDEPIISNKFSLKCYYLSIFLTSMIIEVAEKWRRRVRNY
jgi:hypothetical protein